MPHIAIYPGTFDPLTNGHYDMILRAGRMVDHLIVAISTNPQKDPVFSLDERVAIVKEVCKGLPNVEVDSFKGLLVEYAKKRSVDRLVRGLRAYSDFEYEFQMALTNRKLAPDIETLFMMPKEEYSYISSSMVRQIAQMGGPVDRFAPGCVVEALKRKY